MRRLLTRRRLLFLAPGILLLAAVLSVWLLWAGPGPAARDTTIIVAEGSSVSRVADQLAGQGLIRGGSGSFRLFARLLGSRDPIEGLPPSDPANRRIEFSVIATRPIKPTAVDTPGPR